MANTILLADDNEKLRRSLTHILEESGYLVVEAATGTEALRLLNTSAEFDLLITDLVMPDMEGLELITRLRNSHPKLGIVAISGTFDGKFLPVARLLGVKETLEKPFKRAELLKAVESALSKTLLPALSFLLEAPGLCQF
jgi:CheY-like chemotaxis protein